MSELVKTVARVIVESMGDTPESAARAAIAAVLEHLAENVSGEMVEAARNANWHNVERSAISAALRAAAGGGE